MRVHHLNCGTMRLPTAPLVCHVLLVETERDLVLVDTGFGLADIAQPRRRLGPIRHLIRPVLAEDETAIRQVEALGFAAVDVRHIVLTHFDLDHVGGLADFPHAQVHLTAAEAAGALWSPSRRERLRYNRAQWAHRPIIVEHDPAHEVWRGFPATKALDMIAPGIVLVSLPGHTRGHAAVAVDAGERWVLHAGDAFYHRGTLEGRGPIPRILSVQETLVGFDLHQVRDNHDRLAELHQRGERDLRIINSHDPVLLARMQGADS